MSVAAVGVAVADHPAVLIPAPATQGAFTSLHTGGEAASTGGAALPESVLESELFGHEKGAFTGAINARKGRFEMADKGSLFLDEIGEISASFQAKLLRFAENRRRI